MARWTISHRPGSSPVATAPNAIVFGSGKIRIKDMARAGFALNLLGALVIMSVSLLILD